MRISDWSSDVCSSDLAGQDERRTPDQAASGHGRHSQRGRPSNRDEKPNAHQDRSKVQADEPREIPPSRLLCQHPIGVPHGTTMPDSACAIAEMIRSEEHTSELQSLMRISYAVFCL